MYEFWCGVILRDVRTAILTTHHNEYIYFHIQPITFLLHRHHYHKKLNNIYYIIFINKISKITSLLNKQKLNFKTKETNCCHFCFQGLHVIRMCIQRNFIDKFESTCKFSFVLFILKEKFWDKMLNVKEFQLHLLECI